MYLYAKKIDTVEREKVMMQEGGGRSVDLHF